MKNLAKGATGSSEYLKGLKSGGKQYEKEMDVKIRELNAQKRITKKKQDRGLEL